MKNFVFSMVAALALGSVYAGEKSQAPAKPQAAPAAVKGEKKAVVADCQCQTVEMARKATFAERRAFSRNLVVVEPVKVQKVEVKTVSSCDCCESSAVSVVRRPVRRLRGAVDGLLCR